MQQELLNNLNKPFLRWEYDKDNDWIYLNWIGFISRDNLIKGAGLILDELRKNNYACLLNDNRELCGPWDAAIDYLQTYWIPEARAAGLQYFAHVLAPNVAGALSAQNLHRHTIGNFHMQLFGDMDKAKHWLKSMNSQSYIT